LISMKNKICKFCGTVFQTNNKSLYCSSKCYATTQERMRREKDISTKKTYLIGGKLMVMRPHEMEDIFEAPIVITEKVGNVHVVLGYNKPECKLKD